MQFAGNFFDYDSAIADMEQEQGIGDVVNAMQTEAQEQAAAAQAEQGAEVNTALKTDNVIKGKRDIVNLEDGKTYVTASRKIISGNDVSTWRKQIGTFFDELLDNESSLDIKTLEGDTLTITKKETKRKARDQYRDVNEQKQKMPDEEFKVKLNAEAHIDEIAETSVKQKRKSADNKGHAFAKDGFNYRTAYFQDFDGQYYKLTLSIGNNGEVGTVYNVGKIEEAELPSANIIAVVGSKAPRSSTSANSIPQKSDLSTGSFKK